MTSFKKCQDGGQKESKCMGDCMSGGCILDRVTLSRSPLSSRSRDSQGGTMKSSMNTVSWSPSHTCTLLGDKLISVIEHLTGNSTGAHFGTVLTVLGHIVVVLNVSCHIIAKLQILQNLDSTIFAWLFVVVWSLGCGDQGMAGSQPRPEETV